MSVFGRRHDLVFVVRLDAIDQQRFFRLARFDHVECQIAMNKRNVSSLFDTTVTSQTVFVQ